MKKSAYEKYLAALLIDILIFIKRSFHKNLLVSVCPNTHNLANSQRISDLNTPTDSLWQGNVKKNTWGWLERK